MKEVAVCGIFILIFYAVLSLAMWAGLALLQCSSFGGLAGVLASGTVKWVFLHVFATKLTLGKPQPLLLRLVAHLCLLSPVLESSKIFFASPSNPYMGPDPNVSMLLLHLISSSLACLVWEMRFQGGGQKKTDISKLNVGQLLMRMLRVFKPDTLYIIGAFGFLILGVICDTSIQFYLGKVIDNLGDQIFQSSFYYAVGQLALVSLGSALFTGLRGGTFKGILARLNKRLKNLLFHTILKQEVHFFELNKPGSLSSRLHHDVDKMGRTVALNANAMVRSTLQTCLMLTTMSYLSWELTVLTFIEMPLLAVLQKSYINWSKELKEQIQDCHAHNRDLASQSIKWICTVRSFKAEKEEMRRYNKALDQMCSLQTRSGMCSITFGLIRRFVSLGIKLLMLIQARSLISSGRLTTGSLVSFFLYQKPMTNSLKEILYCYGETMSTVGIISKVFAYLDRTPKCKKEGELAPEKLKGRIVFQNVTFSHPSAPSDKPALKSVSMELKPGQITALVGPSGSGKTSCVSLLKRLYEPQEGQILLDGKPLHMYKQKYLHQKIALVSQDPEFFPGSVRDNIVYGLKDCTMEKVKEAAKKAKADDFISEMNNGYDTEIGEGGDKLSKGQQHCIAIIRALVRDPQVIILDETTGKVDVEVWHAVLQEVLSHGQTLLVVAHQLKTVEKAHHIIFLEKGEVVEEGTHQNLMAKEGRYYQFSQNIL